MSFLWDAPSHQPAQPVHRTVYDDALPYHPLATPAPAPTHPDLLGSLMGGFGLNDHISMMDTVDAIGGVHDGVGYARDLSGLATAARAPGATDSLINRVFASGPAQALLTNGPLKSFLGSKPVDMLESDRVDNALGAKPLGAISAVSQLATAAGELVDPKERTQGVMDGIAGGLSLGALACPALEAPAFVAGLAATGNETTKNLGLWGQDASGENKDSVQWSMDNTANAWNWGRNVGAGTGSRVLTDVFGAGAGLVAGVGSGLIAGAADIGAGAIQTGVDAVHGIAQTGIGLAQFGGEVLTNPGQAVNDAVNFGGNVVNTVANTASTVGNDVMGIVNDPGQAVQNAAGIAGNVVNGAVNVVGGAANVVGSVGGGILQGAQALGNDIGADAGNVVNGVGNFLGSLF